MSTTVNTVRAGAKFCLSIILSGMVIIPHALADTICPLPLTGGQIKSIFTQNAFKQLAMEFGEDNLKVYSVEQHPVGKDMMRVEAYAKYKKPGVKEPATMRVQAWVSRCQGTTIIRGNTWLADGNLIVPRYNESELPGKGIVLGKDDAPVRLIVFVDSRCPHCHRLLGYAQKLAAQGGIQIDIRQVAVLESIEEALQDTRIMETPLVNPQKFSVSIENYFDMLAGLNNEAAIDQSHANYIAAKDILIQNTHTAQNILHINTVPGVLIRESDKDGHYRLMGYWEMNRLFQPDL